jgi:hypothetical protein
MIQPHNFRPTCIQIFKIVAERGPKSLIRRFSSRFGDNDEGKATVSETTAALHVPGRKRA